MILESESRGQPRPECVGNFSQGTDEDSAGENPALVWLWQAQV